MSALVRANDTALHDLLSQAAARFPGRLAVYVKHLKTGETAAVAGDTPMDSMSVIKLAILVKAYQMNERHELRLTERVTLHSSDRRGGSGILQFHTSGLNPTLRDLLLEMVITSDNTATDVMLKRVGGAQALNAWLETSGFVQLRMQRSVGDYFRGYMAAFEPTVRSLSNAQIYEAMMGPPLGESAQSPAVAAAYKKLDAMSADEGNKIAQGFYRDPTLRLGTITAAGIGRFLEGIETAALVSPADAKEITRLMKWQKSGERRMPHYIDMQYSIAHKTGDGPPSIANDVGIVYLDSGPAVIAILANDIEGNYGEAEDAEAQLTRAIATYFDGPRK
jgi:beta-lactamase class A